MGVGVGVSKPTGSACKAQRASSRHWSLKSSYILRAEVGEGVSVSVGVFVGKAVSVGAGVSVVGVEEGADVIAGIGDGGSVVAGTGVSVNTAMTNVEVGRTGVTEGAGAVGG